jgi:choline transport protein
LRAVKLGEENGIDGNMCLAVYLAEELREGETIVSGEGIDGFCIGDIEATANTSTGVPVIQIIYDSTGSKAATCGIDGNMCLAVYLAEELREGETIVSGEGIDGARSYAIEFGTTTGFQTVIAISTEGFCKFHPLHLMVPLLNFEKGRLLSLAKA